jgi:hypothetical protein
MRQNQVTDHYPQTANQPPLLGNGGKSKIGMHDGDIRGKALPYALPHQPTRRQRVERLHNLEGTVIGIRPGVPPGIHPQSDYVKGKVGKKAAHHITPIAGSQIEQRQEEDKEQGSCAQVTLPDEQQQAKAPHEQKEFVTAVKIA